MQEPFINVGIMSAESINFFLSGRYSIYGKEIGAGLYKTELSGNAIFLENQTYDEVMIIPLEDDTFFELKDVVIGINFHWERKENQRFEGALKLIIEKQADDLVITAVNVIAVESYLKCVISSEMSATASSELLKAHAVISRSWLLSSILQKNGNAVPKHEYISNIDGCNTLIRWYERDAHDKYHVCADDHCQRYQGITRATTTAVNEAIEATRAEVLMYNNEICDARYSKSCGGFSETFDTCWAPEHHAYLSGVADNDIVTDDFNPDLTIEENAEKWIRSSPPAFCNNNDPVVLSQVLNHYDQETTDFYRWKVEYMQEQLADLLFRRSGIDFGSIVDLIPLKRGVSGRIHALKIIGTKETIVVGKELEIRKWLSESHLYSSAFVVDKSGEKDGLPERFTLTGAGWGHGVGLCQIGAAVMGEKGYSYTQILYHYFRGSKLKHIY